MSDRREFRAYRMKLRNGKAENYIRAHRSANVWPEVIDGLAKAGIDRQVIFQCSEEIVIFEEAKDLGSSYTRLASDLRTREWDEMVESWVEDYPRFDPKLGDISAPAVPILFYFENGRLRTL